MTRMSFSTSFRDPDGSVLCSEDRVFRSVNFDRVSDFRMFVNSRTAQTLVADESLVGTRELRDTDDGGSNGWVGRDVLDALRPAGTLFEHDHIWFPSYPYEWSPEMLFHAGRLTLQIAKIALEEGYGLKDATPYNVLFNGPKPVFVDLLSFERREESDSTWLPYAQFLRMFLLPLLAYKYFGSQPHSSLLTKPHGIEPEDLYRQSHWARRIRPPFLTSISIPTWLGQQKQPGKKNVSAAKGPVVHAEAPHKQASDKSQFILSTQFRRLERMLNAVQPHSVEVTSVWSGYTRALSYSSIEVDHKKEVVGRWLAASQPNTVLDIGCNTGTFSEIAARFGAAVLAIDSDPVVIGRLVTRAQREKLNILPLVVDLAHPTPATGWRNAENPSFMDRATNRFETVMMLAVVHHLLVTERVPLPNIVDLAASLTRRDLILEYVDSQDEMFQQLLRGRDHLYSGFNQEFFESTCQQRFTIIEKQAVKGSLRTLYLLRKK